MKENNMKQNPKICDIAQLADVKLSVLKEGKEAGVNIAQIDNGSGLVFTVVLDRCMDLGKASVDGKNVSWLSGTGYTNPSYFDAAGSGWLGSFFGGLLSTCGLMQVGSPCEDAGEKLGQHGRIGNMPAKNIKVNKYWKNGKYFLEITGVMNEIFALVENMQLTRKITVIAGEKKIFINDIVENCGTAAAPHMILYHFNFGYPLLDEKAVLNIPSSEVVGNGDAAEAAKKDCKNFGKPIPGFIEHVFYHEMKTAKNGDVKVGIENKKLNLGVTIKYNQKELPKFVEWKNPKKDVYVLGLEPGNCWTQGRAAERKRGTLQFMRPGEVRKYNLEVNF